MGRARYIIIAIVAKIADGTAKIATLDLLK
jgi:hypothetical protein